MLIYKPSHTRKVAGSIPAGTTRRSSFEDRPQRPL